MPFNTSSSNESISVVKLRPAPLRDRVPHEFMRLDAIHGKSHSGVRNLIRDDLLASTPALVRLPPASSRYSTPVLVFPGERVIEAAGGLTWAIPSAYVIQNRELRRLNDVSLCAGRAPFQLNVTVLQHAFTSGTAFAPVTKAHFKALQSGDLVRRLLATRQAVWDHHVRHMQINPDKCRYVHMIVRHSRYLVDVTTHVESLLAQMQTAEWAQVKAFLAPLNQLTVSRDRRRPTVHERQRNRCQALEAYPFLESICAAGSVKDELYPATSLLSVLSPRDVKTVRRIIDEGWPLSAVLARELRLEPWMIEHVARHWPAYLEFDRLFHPDGNWDVRAMLSLWTPETAPKTLEELKRLDSLAYWHLHCATPRYRGVDVPMSPGDRRTLRQLVRSAPDCEEMLGYLRFLRSLNRWILNEVGRDCSADLPHLLGIKHVDDWQVCARRWHAINAELKRRAGENEALRDPSAQREWPALLTRVENVGDFTFHSLHTYQDLKAESLRMQNCASTYSTLCALGESHMIHIALAGTPVGTLEVRKELYGENTKMLLVHAEAACHAPLTGAAEQALYRFLDACNDGGIALNPEALQPQSLRMELLASMLQSQCLDYPTWEQADTGHDYFFLHAYVGGNDFIEHYRTALELEKDAKESLYVIASRAVRQCRRAVVSYGNFSVAR